MLVPDSEASTADCLRIPLRIAGANGAELYLLNILSQSEVVFFFSVSECPIACGKRGYIYWFLHMLQP